MTTHLLTAVVAAALGAFLAVGLAGSVAGGLATTVFSCTLDVTPPDCHEAWLIGPEARHTVEPDYAATLPVLIPQDPVLLFVSFVLVVMLWEAPRIVAGATVSRSARAVVILGGSLAVGGLAIVLFGPATTVG